MWKTLFATILGKPKIVHAPDTGTTSALSIGQPSATAKVTPQQIRSADGGIDCVPLFERERAGPFGDSRDDIWGRGGS